MNNKNKISSGASLIYITNVRIPTEKAHGLQIMKMCEAFALLKIRNLIKNQETTENLSVQLIIPRRINSIGQNPFDYYGVRQIFNIKKILCLDFFWLKIIPTKISFYLQWFSFALIASVYAFIKYRKNENIFYSRDWLVLFFLGFFGFKPVAEIHDYKAEKPKKWWMGYAMRKAKKIITNSDGTKIFLKEHYEIPDDKFLVASNGVDLDFFNIKETKVEARQKLNLPPDKIIISYIGRLETLGMEKGVGDLISSFYALRQERNSVFLCVIGGPDNLVAKYKNFTDSLGIDKEECLFTGQIKYNLIPLYLRAIDIVVVPFPPTKQFSFTASPIKVFEFMAAGKIIIASDLPALRFCLSSGNASFFKAGDRDDLAKKLKDIINQIESAKNLSKQALIDAKKYSWLSRAEKIIKFIDFK